MLRSKHLDDAALGEDPGMKLPIGHPNADMNAMEKAETQ